MNIFMLTVSYCSIKIVFANFGRENHKGVD